MFNNPRDTCKRNKRSLDEETHKRAGKNVESSEEISWRNLGYVIDFITKI